MIHRVLKLFRDKQVPQEYAQEYHEALLNRTGEPEPEPRTKTSNTARWTSHPEARVPGRAWDALIEPGGPATR